MLAAVMAISAACSGGSGEGQGGTTTVSDPTATSSPAGGPETSVGPGSSPVAPTEASFTLPADRLDAVDAAGLRFEEFDYPVGPDDVPWPTESWPTGELSDEVDAAEVQAIVDRAFGELSADGQTIDAILVADDGRLVVEEYNGWDPEAPHMSWSMAKSINAALIGMLVGEGRLDIFEPVDAPEWSAPDDPRGAITLDQLLRMSSGLAWEESYVDPAGDVLATLGGDADRAGYTAQKPLAVEPDTEWSYSTGTANLIARSVADEVGYGDELTGWIDEELFDPLGIDTVEHNLDATGLISGGSWINLTPQDFARFGLLFARNGIWDGRRLLPDGWVDYSRMPTPTNEAGTYGAQWWLDPDRPGMFFASGFNGQTINVVPEEDLVIVVLSTAGDGRDNEVREALFDLFEV